jgi:hypothetical protein
VWWRGGNEPIVLDFEVHGHGSEEEKPALLVIELMSSGPGTSHFTDAANTISAVKEVLKWVELEALMKSVQNCILKSSCKEEQIGRLRR